MPTVFGHAIIGLTAARLAPASLRSVKTYLLATACAALPDLDMLAHSSGFAHSVFGHRGLTHSLPFAVLIGLLVTLAGYGVRAWRTKSWWLLVLIFSFAAATHPLLDACTNGGRAIALFAPFSWQTYFAPWRPLEVSPFWFGIFSARGWHVIQSELLWLALPCALLWSWRAERRM